METKTIIFDMDGVLVDSEPVYLQAFQAFLEENGCAVNPEILKAVAGASVKDTWTYMSWMWKEPITPDELHKEFRRQHPDFQIPYKEVMFEGLEKLLYTLRERGMTIALASSSPEKSIKRMLAETGLEGYFSVIVSGEMFKESKPNPEIYLYTLSRIGASPKDCIVVEDSTYGIQAAKAAGIPVIAIRDRRFSYDQSSADFLIDSTVDLIEILDEN